MSLLSSVTTKIALKKVGLPSNTLDFSSWSAPPTEAPRQPNKLRKKPPPQKGNGYADDEMNDNSWGAWMSSFNAKSLPLTVHPWLTPPPPPVQVARVAPNVGDVAPIDRGRKLKLGGGKRCLVVFLRCVGCAFAKKTFLNLRAIANRYSDSIHCIAVSHSSAQATKKWIDILGGPWNVEVLIDEDRSVYASWGLGTTGLMYLLHPEVQMSGWKDKDGWLSEEVATYLQRKGLDTEVKEVTAEKSAFEKDEEEDEEVRSVMGSKWQEAGAFAVDGKGTVVWGGRALRADDVMDLELGAQILQL